MSGDARKILINALHAKTGGGVTYLKAMLPRLAADKRLDLHVLLHENQLGMFASDIPAELRLHTVSFKDGFVRRLVWEQTALPPLAWNLADVCYSPANFGPLLAPRPVVLLRNALDVAKHDRRPAKQLYWKALSLMTWLSLLAAPQVIAVSGYAKCRLSFGFARKVSVIHHGVDKQRFRPSGAGRQDYVLAVGDITVQKNFPALIEAAARLSGCKLLIAGKFVDAEHARGLEALIESLDAGGRIRLLGQLSADELAKHYQDCALMAFSSTVETFGNPLVEAMAAGAPIVCSDSAAMPEILGDAGLLVPPGDVGAWERAMAGILNDPAQAADLSKRALDRAQAFSWDETARRTADLLASVAASTSAPRLKALAWIWVAVALAAYLAQFLNIWPAIAAALSITP